MMSGLDRSELGDDIGGSLVTVIPAAPRVCKRPLVRPDPSFVTQLIANAEQVPQVRRLRRASAADARLAYTGARPARTGCRTQQIV